ncbi:MAG: hypothetical protein MJE77_05115 [Proteobacteria bacterium]|nr:hypothetical protein [Pseudomonadota bacterium]
MSSYHPEYLWSQDTSRGFVAAMKELGYFASRAHVAEFTGNDRVETPWAEVRKLWMDTKRHPDQNSIAGAVNTARAVVDEYKPTIILLGDDNAANFIGNLYLDTDVPIVFWGMNGLPGKYGLIDSPRRPGHNVTGVYQAGYLEECIAFLKKIAPRIETLAVLSDDSPTGRSKVKALESLSERRRIPVEVVGTVVTNSAPQWRSGARRLADRADAFFVLNHNTLHDQRGKPVDPLKLGAWYLRNIRKPDCGHERQFAIEGILATADDSGFYQAYEAVHIAHKILDTGADPGLIPVRAPRRGPLIANRYRARMLGIELTEEMGIEEYIDTALALDRYPE